MEFDKMNQLFENYFQKTEDFYGISGMARRFATIFSMCPFMTLIGEMIADEDKTGYEGNIMGLISEVYNSSELGRGADDKQEKRE